MSLERHYYPEVGQVRKNARNFLNKAISSNLKKDKDVLLLLSGGSVLSLYSVGLLGLSNRVTIGVLDERYSDDPKVNNFQTISQTQLYKQAKKSGCNFIDTSLRGSDSAQELAERFEKELRQWKNDHPDGIVIVTQGMGPDGHTAGMMPYPESKSTFEKLFENQDSWVVGYDSGNKNPFPRRVTTTMKFLRDIVDISIFFAAPPVDTEERTSKITILRKILSKQSLRLHKYPAAIIRRMKNVHIFTNIK